MSWTKERRLGHLKFLVRQRSFALYFGGTFGNQIRRRSKSVETLIGNAHAFMLSFGVSALKVIRGQPSHAKSCGQS